MLNAIRNQHSIQHSTLNIQHSTFLVTPQDVPPASKYSTAIRTATPDEIPFDQKIEVAVEILTGLDGAGVRDQ
jgi:hypothetical protein